MNLDQLEKLSDLKQKGILNEDEFEKAKKEILEQETDKDNKKEVDKNGSNTTLNGKDNIVINNNINSGAYTPSVISIGTVLSWFIGILTILYGIGSIPGTSAIFLILAGIVILPITTKMLIRKFNTKLSGGLKFILFILLFAIGSGLK
jgi:hypothetical protein